MALLVAHRGFRSTEGENRIIDFQNALKICQAVEFDIRLTKDNKVIIFHDDTFERIANNKSEVSSLLYEEIINLEFFKNNKEWIPPLFNDFIEKLSKNYQMINVEIKEEINRKYTSNQLMVIFSEIKKLEKKSKAEIIVSSFNHQLLNEIVKRIKYPMKKGYLFENKNDFNERYIKNFDYLHPSISVVLDFEMISKLKKLKKPLNIWTFKSDEEAVKINEIYGNQVAGYISDNPKLLWKQKNK
ncbi:glycerophosphodiester phosphodiesterase family protein [Spiroplasma endosymbiont of Villa modesta]|uniref:glycerophosphodiester phosphodiesterase family protein n=1 Tax=Spiroplasma endosymbiont of Villa modesta TaxID=3066293 RepID=UPI00313E2896